MSTPEELLRQALAAHKAGRLTEAEAGYRRLLRKRPADPAALQLLSLLHFHRGEHGAAIEYLRESLARRTENPRGWNDLGGMLVAAGRVPEAKSAYRRATQIAPHLAEGWYNLAVCQRKDGEVDAAIDNLRQALAQEPGYTRAYDALATLLYQLGRTSEVAEVYRRWHEQFPQDPRARHMAAATSGQNIPSRAPDDYVQQLFDTAAAGFDANLETLRYQAPVLTATALAHWAPKLPLDAVLDAGCGTGLCGPHIRGCCRHLTGIDLSEKMIERARERGCYDDLAATELSAYMQVHREAFDAVICADTLVYFGPLAEPLKAAHNTLRDSGLLIFTVEAASGAQPPEHRLEAHGRYTHSESYLRQALPDCGFELLSLTREALRQERDQDVLGYLIVARRN